MKKKILAVAIFCFLFLTQSEAQIDKYSQINLHPVSPTAFQFLKYTELPVSEYTGLANISVPIYQVNVDEVKIPIQLTYHSQGIRVSQEASWVGLGWDLQLGSVIQQINDRDDYGTDIGGINNVKRLPDYFPVAGDGTPWVLPMGRLQPFTTAGNGWSDPYPINQVQAKQGFAISTGYYIPVDGHFSNPEQDLFNIRWYDSEPDFFTASFLGETIKFIIDFKQGGFVILNNAGYSVYKTSAGFQITNPNGTNFYFEIKSTVQNETNSTGIEGMIGSGSLEDVSNIFLLSKIITKNGKVITFNYTKTSSNLSYTSCSGKFQALSDPNDVTQVVPMGGGDYVFANLDARTVQYQGGDYQNYSINSEQYYYLSSIVFPEGEVDFTVSDRTDMAGGKKLDAIQLRNNDDVMLSSWTLDYSYFDASEVSGNGYMASTLDTAAKSSLRLKLLDVKQPDGGIYNFSYNNTSLPKKNSYATDYWGFYNGQLTNNSFSPNPAALGMSTLGNNSNNRDANLTYAKAAMLESIQYPTGGKVTLDYELNEFDVSQMMGMPLTPSTIQGCGLRVKSITHYANDQSQALKKAYSYEGGKLISPLQIFRQLPYVWLRNWNLSSISTTSYTLSEFTCNGVFSSNPLGSINGVGYDKVTNQEQDLNGIAKGKTVTEFYNKPDQVVPISNRVYNCSIPYVKSISDPENGSVKTVTLYNSQNSPIRTTTNNYNVLRSNIYYGARIMGNGTLYYGDDGGGQFSIPQNAIGYFPIYDITTLLASSSTTEYDDNGNSLVTNVTYGYDLNNQLSYKQTSTSTGGYLEQYYNHAYDYYQQTGDASLVTSHIFSEVTGGVSKRLQSNGISTDLYSYNKQYTTVSGKVVPSSATIYDHPGPSQLPKTITYDQYDSYANPLQLTSDGIISSMLWDYNNEHLVAEVKGAAVSQIAYTSFEADGEGNWIFSGVAKDNPFAITGRKDYLLTNGSISKTGLDAAKTYIVSYWSKSGAQSVSGSTATQTGITTQGWTYYEHTIQNSTSITVSGTGEIDELRLYPKGSLMTTYTYQPLVGITSICDQNNRVSYYQYDGSNRLTLVKDENGKILKKYCYNYQGQQESCYLYSSAAIDQDYSSQNCSSSEQPLAYHVSVPAGMFVSSVSQDDANSRAQQYAQGMANKNGTCVPSVTLYYNNTSAVNFEIYLTNTTLNQSFWVWAYASSSGVLADLPAGTYSFDIMPDDSPTNHTYELPCNQYSTTGYDDYEIWFNDVPVNTSCNTLTIH